MGLDPAPYGLHSARVGGAQYLENGRFSGDDLGIVGGWGPNSVMPARYAREALGKRVRAAKILCLN